MGGSIIGHLFRASRGDTLMSYIISNFDSANEHRSMYYNRDRLHLRRTTEQHVPEVEVQVKRRRTASLSNQECQLYPRRSQQQQIPVVDFQAELRQAFLAETPRGG
ncbi:SNURF protein isoform X1 [Castor canadensis]|uniref:SNURF protein isoform X1 n=2 Tax=Castor canadensis TaxID=51338 RepID=A0AC58LL12_CASCN